MLNHIQSSGLTLRKDKCTFFKKEVTYLGHVICADGVKPKPSFVSEIISSPRPKHIDELRSFLGLCECYSKFIQNYSDIEPMQNVVEILILHGMMPVKVVCTY